MWLYVPHIKLSIEEVIKIGKEFQIPSKVIFNKYAHFLKSSKDMTPANIKIELLKYYDGVSDEVIENLVELVPPTQTEIKNAMRLIEPFKKLKISKPLLTTHQGYPEVNADLGRARINWNECYHKDCHKTFGNTMEFKKHLESAGALTHRFCSLHEEAVANHHLTIEKILGSNMTTCPSIVCDKKKFSCPEDLIRHFMMLGIPPFWKQGMKMEVESKSHPILNRPGGLLLPINSVEQCIICFERKPFVLFVECCHHICCFECFVKATPKECLLCRQKIRYVIPY